MVKDLIALDNSSRVWIYASDTEFSHDELDSIRPEIYDFLEKWTSHNRNLISYGNIFHKRFLALFVDESIAGASGCSIDKSVHFIENLGSRYSKDFFNRMNLFFMIDDEVIQISMNEFPAMIASGKMDGNTLFFDNLVKDKDQFLKSWIKPVKDSWLKRFLK